VHCTPQRNYTRPTELSSVKYPLILNMWKRPKNTYQEMSDILIYRCFIGFWVCY
jgi:hypothetical protein